MAGNSTDWSTTDDDDVSARNWLTTDDDVSVGNWSLYDDDDAAWFEMDDVGGGGALVVVASYVLPVVVVFGIVGIVITLVVLCQKVMLSSTNCHLTALTAADLAFLVLLLAASSVRPQLRSWRAREHYDWYFLHYAAAFMLVFLTASVWLTLVLAVERYIAICRPFLAAKLCSVRKARLVIVLVYGAALLVRLPVLLEYQFVTVFDQITNSSVRVRVEAAFKSQPAYTRLYPWLVDGLLLSIAPFILLLILNVCLIREVRKSTRYLQRNLHGSGSGACGGGSSGASGAAQREEFQISVMLISVVVVFFVCQAPYVVYTALLALSPHRRRSTPLDVFRLVTVLLVVLKSALNFIVYCWFSDKFWTTLRRICRRSRVCGSVGRGGRHSHNTSYYNLQQKSATRDTVM